MEFWQHRPQSRGWGHVLHCIDALRQDIVYNANDSTATRSPESGMGQVRQCRSWEKLERWARRHNACYSISTRRWRICRRFNASSTVHGIHRIERRWRGYLGKCRAMRSCCGFDWAGGLRWLVSLSEAPVVATYGSFRSPEHDQSIKRSRRVSDSA